MPAWTPGPWFIERHADILNVSAAGRVGRVEIAAVEIDFFSDEVNAEQSANAQLIAAAPDLFQSLDDLMSLFEVIGYPDGHQKIEAARAALAKARSTP